MILNKQIIKIAQIFLILFLILNWSVSAQQTIKIIDSANQHPVSDVFFNYNEVSGISNLQGEIHIKLVEGNVLQLSHVQFGKVEFESEEVKKLVAQGFVELELMSHQLLPVTYVGVHSETGRFSELDIPVQQKLEHDAGKLLEQLPAFSVIRKSGSYGFDPVLRGFKYDQINLVLDGVQTASAACPNRMDPAISQIPINMINSVEVFKGPFSLRYGNSFGGTINFESSSPEFKEKTKALGRVGSSYESNGNIFRTEGVAGFSGKNTDLRFFGSYSTGEDYKDGNNNLVQSGFNRLNWGGKLGFRINDKQKLGVFVSNNRAKDVDFAALPMDLRDDDTWLVNGNHSAFFYNTYLTTWKTAVYFTHVDHLMDNFDKLLDPRKVDASTKANTLNYGGRTELRFDFNSGFLYSGLDYRFEAADGERTRVILMGPMAGKTMYDNVWQDAQIRRGGLFSEYHWETPKIYLVFSGRLDYNSALSNNPDPTFSNLYPKMDSEYINPSFSAGGTAKLSKSFSLGLWLGTAQRSPGIAERYINFFPIGLDPYEMLGNPQLKPEINNQFDLILDFNLKSARLKLDVYVSMLRNYISSEIDQDIKPKMATSPGVRQFINIDNAQIAGFEFEWKQKITGFLNHRFSMVYTYGENKVTNEALPEIPPFELKYQLYGSFLQEKLQPEILFRQVFKQDRIALSYGETETPAFNVIDAKVSWFATSLITVSGGVLNLFDTAYYEHLSRSVRGVDNLPIYSPGRSAFVTLTFSFM